MLVIVVTLPVENYVERVVASESGPGDSPESLKALAIVVRSFALHEAHGHADYDLCDSTHCQLLHWSGNGDRRAAAHAATLATAGETLWFHGQRALAYFGKDCGGRTASPDEIWPRAKPLPYLPSQPDRFCTANGAREWASEITRADLTAALAAHGLAQPGWQNLTVARRGASGRAVTLQLDRTEISAEDFQLAVGESLGWNRIPSTWFEVSRQGDRFAFHGRGWGHGVGLCQKGAAAMAAQGRTAREILAQYFPGAEAADEATGRDWQSFAGDGFVLESLDAGDAAFLPALNRARAEASAAIRPACLRSVHRARLRVHTRTFARPRWRRAGSRPSPKETGSARSPCARWPRGNFWPIPCATSFCMRWWSARLGRRRRSGCAKDWSKLGAKPPRHKTAFDARPNSRSTQSTPLSRTPQAKTESEAAHRAAAWYAAQLLTATAARRCSIGCAQVFPPASSPLSGSGSFTESSSERRRSRQEPATSASSPGVFAAVAASRASSTAAHASSRTQLAMASRYAPASFRLTAHT